jgi:hypothetical protein
MRDAEIQADHSVIRRAWHSLILADGLQIPSAWTFNDPTEFELAFDFTMFVESNATAEQSPGFEVTTINSPFAYQMYSKNPINFYLDCLFFLIFLV